MEYTLGIDMGASSVKLAALSEGEQVLYLERRPHYGSPVKTLAFMLAKLDETFSFSDCAAFAVTGGTAGVLREYLEEIPEFEAIPAITEGVRILAPQTGSVIAVGAQTAVFVARPAGGWSEAPRFSVNESCASGTGSFFEDQMERLGMRIGDYSKLIQKAAGIPRLSGRCAVFAKTDIIHRQQEGVPVEDILLGLCYAMVKSYKSTIVRGLPVQKPVLLTGGVSLNRGVAQAVREVFALKEGELLGNSGTDTPSRDWEKKAVCLQAVGAAKGAQKMGGRNLQELAAALQGEGAREALPTLEPLVAPPLNSRMDTTAAQAEVIARWEAAQQTDRRPDMDGPAGEDPRAGGAGREAAGPEDGRTDCTLGVDVGSTSTNLVLLDGSGRLVDYQYLRTRGNPKEAVRLGMASMEERLGKYIRIRRIGVTGSGRGLIGKMLGAQTIRDEITAQAKGAVMADPSVDTVFEIGGQDSKYISIRGGQVADFQMNKICAAGTGSFIEEQAARLGIPIGEYGALALTSQAPLDLGERCTVFVETAIHSALAKGAKKNDIAAGLCLSVVRNYLHKVVGTKPVGRHIVLQGGVAYNPATVAAFRQFYGDRITVSPWFPVSGAIGAAFLAQEEEAREQAAGLAKKDAAGQPESMASIKRSRECYAETKKLYVENYTPPTVESGEIGPDGKLCCRQKTVGIPRCLMLHKLFPMANGFFSELGFRVVLSEESSEETVRLSQQTCRSECCYPVKLVHGHMEQLARLGVDYIFMPAMHTIRHICSRVEHNYACPFMQTAPMMAAEAIGLKERGITLISPVLDMDFGEEMLASAMLDVGKKLGFQERETSLAMLTGGFAVNEFTRRTEAFGEEIVKALRPGEKAIVLITRQYGIEDPALNMDISMELMDRGYKVLNLSHLHAHNLDISDEYPGMYWPFGQHILSGARIVRSTPGLYAVYLTNHGCGPDTMLAHLFREEMAGKPYLQIEVDEHYSKVGVVTRIEAFLNSLEQNGDGGFEKEWLDRLVARSVQGSDAEKGCGKDCQACGAETPPKEDLFGKWEGLKTVRQDLPLQKGAPTGVPGYGIYGKLIAGCLTAQGYPSYAMPPERAALEEGRRETTSKEYYTFSMLLGMCLRMAQKERTAEEGAAPAGARGKSGDLQLLIPANEGADADGQYWRVIRAILDEKGKTDVKVSPVLFDAMLYRYPRKLLEELFLQILAGDLYYMAPAGMREELWEGAGRTGAGGQKGNDDSAGGEDPGTISWTSLQAAAEMIRDAKARTEKAVLLVTGEWPLVYEDTMAGGIWSGLERKGYLLKRMPFSEYLWFLWNDRENGAAKSRTGTGREDVQKILKDFRSQMEQLHGLLGAASAFSEDLDGLIRLASAELGSFTSANGRYRYGKKAQMAGRTAGIINVASMYENTDMILRDHDDTLPVPVLNLAFDGVQDEGVRQKLQSFLYYL